MTTLREFRLPDLGEGLTESDLVSWHVRAGDRVELNQVIAEVETAKALVEIPSPCAGVVQALHAEEGQTVEVGEPLLTFEVADDAVVPEGGGAPARPPSGGEAAPVSADAGPEVRSDAEREEALLPNLVGYGARPERAGRPRRRPRRYVAAASGASGPATSGHPATNGHRTSDGHAARVTETRTPVRGVRKHTAAAMAASVRTAPQASVFLTVDVTASMELLARLRSHPMAGGTRVTVLALVARAVCALLPLHPALTTRWEELPDGGAELVRPAHVNLGVAVATDRGLVVPHVPEADRLSLTELARAVGQLTETAREGRTPPERLTGGTLTITNVGVFGVDAGTPILNPGEPAILGLGQVARRPWEHDGEVALRQVMTLSLTFDHRVVDGEQGARFLADLGAVLEDPALAMLLGGESSGGPPTSGEAA